MRRLSLFLAATILSVPSAVYAGVASDVGNATTKAASDVGKATSNAASNAGTQIEKAVGGSDTLSAADLQSAVPASTVANAPRTFASAKVDDMSGNIIGPVRRVTTDSVGKPDMVHLEVGGFLGIGERVVAVKASDLKYIPSRNILVTSLSKSQIEAMKPVVN